MSGSPLGPFRSTPQQLRERLAAERRGTPFLLLRDETDVQRIIDLARAGDRLTLGRSPQCDLALVWDPKVSRLHAELETHLRALFRAFELEDLPQSEKRRRLVAAALSSGLVQDKDL
jgi:hypothetical protein